MPLMSRPRAATSLATRSRTSLFLKRSKVSVRFGCGMSAQRSAQRVDIALAIAEYQRVLDILGANQPPQRFALFGDRYDDERLDHGRRRRCRRGYRDLDRV